MKGTNCHPTADWIFNQTKKIIPNISLGTVSDNQFLVYNMFGYVATSCDTEIKEEFITMYSYSNFFEVIERMIVTNPDNFNYNQPRLGSLDIREVKNSDYFFA